MGSGGTTKNEKVRTYDYLVVLLIFILSLSEIALADVNDEHKQAKRKSKECYREIYMQIENAREGVRKACKGSRKRSNENLNCDQAKAALKLARDGFRDKFKICRNGSTTTITPVTGGTTE